MLEAKAEALKNNLPVTKIEQATDYMSTTNPASLLQVESCEDATELR